MTKISDVKISIIVPVYAAESYLESCVKSITAQTHENLQIILVNDGSPDSSGKICDELARSDGRITVIHKERGGVSSARNRGLDVADGEWIGFVDSDDRIEPDMYAYLLAKAREHGADLVQCATFFDEDTATAILNSPENDIAVRCRDELSLEFFKYLSGGTCSKLFKRERIEGVRYDESLTIGEDMRFNLDAIFASRLTVLATEPKYHYVQRPGSACHS